MFDIQAQEFTWGGKEWRLETGRVARQATGAVLASCGGTVVLATVVSGRQLQSDFLPLTVHYQEKQFAAGRIPGGFFKREGRPSEKETLTSRLIDRPLRPLFPRGYYNETQLVCTLLSHDSENEPDIVAMVGASAALAISSIPVTEAIAGARIGKIKGQYQLNPSHSDLKLSRLDLVMAGTREGILMVESQAQELSEEEMLEALAFGFAEFTTPLDAIAKLVTAAGKEKVFPAPADDSKSELEQEIRASQTQELTQAYAIRDKQERTQQLERLRTAAAAAYEDEAVQAMIPSLLKDLELEIVRTAALKNKERIDGRQLDEVRQLAIETGVLPRVHGSSLFTRGETQALAVATLGTGEDEQIIDAIEGEYRETFLLHYNFPPFSVGEATPMRPPGRREIGHGKLAWRALRPLLPSAETFPYTIRVVSEITESNGSSSMATVCAASLALMSAGVPLSNACAGIAMGLIKQGDDYVILSDILGDEDHLGDMDFKVAGTHSGITSLQMDIKITSITQEIMSQALAQAKLGRLYILSQMNEVLPSVGDMSRYAPRIESLTVPKEKIREIIGTGGKVIRQIVEETGAKIDIDDDGTVRIASNDGDALTKALDWINAIVAEPEAGKVYRGKVATLMDFGAFVDIMPGRSGLVHVSNIANHRVETVSSVLSEGQEVWVKCIEIDPRGKVRLSMRHVDQESGEELDVRPDKGAPPRSDHRPARPARRPRRN